MAKTPDFAALGAKERCTLQVHPDIKQELQRAQLSHEHFWQTVHRILQLGLEAQKSRGVNDAA